jgi:signal transduction histidine kinase
VFLKARLKLTALYVLIVAVIILGFSIFLYQSIERNLNDSSEEDFSGIDSHHHFVQNTLDSVQNELIFADIVILITAAGLSFILAGRTLRPIQLSVEAQKAFAANASHELRTPLAVIRNDIEVFLRSTAQTKDIAETTMKSNLDEVKRMSHIVEDLLVLARSDNHILATHTDVEVSILIQNTVNRMRALAENRKVQLSNSVSVPTKIKGNNDQIERAFLNILQNSIDHTPSGGTVHISTEKKDSEVIIRIVDTGSGIPAKDLPNIFKRFYKGDSGKGTGLGLSIVKEIVDQHRGHISVESIETKGTTFTIHLPLV